MTDQKAALPPLPEALDKSNFDAVATGAIPPDREIDVSFFSYKNRKSTRLISNNSEDGAMRARREWLGFDLHEPVYITTIKIIASGYEDYHEMELSLIDALTGDEYKEKRRYSGGVFQFEPKRFVKGFGLRPDESWSFTKSQYINKIEVRGLEQKSFFEVVQIYENMTREKLKIEESLTRYFERAKKAEQEIGKSESKLQELAVDVQKEEENISTLRSTILALSKERDELNKRIESGASIEKERNERVQAIEIGIENLNSKRKDINSRIQEEERKLKEIKDNIDLFPTEISGYVGQGTRNIKLYAWFSLVPVCIIAYVTYRLFANAERLLNFDISGSPYDILKYLLSRSPYVIVSATVLGICYSIVRSLFFEVVAINRRRQELFKVSIIASDVSFASQRGIELTPEQLYDLRTQTKMELLKEHLKVNLGEDFVYSPGSDFSRKLNLIANNRDISDDQANQDKKE